MKPKISILSLPIRYEQNELLKQSYRKYNQSIKKKQQQTKANPADSSFVIQSNPLLQNKDTDPSQAFYSLTSPSKDETKTSSDSVIIEVMDNASSVVPTQSPRMYHSKLYYP